MGVAARAMVLLRNEPIDGAPPLPLSADRLSRLAVVGRLADVPNTGGYDGSSDVRAPEIVTALAGLRTALPDGGCRSGRRVGRHGGLAAERARDADGVVLRHGGRQTPWPTCCSAGANPEVGCPVFPSERVRSAAVRQERHKRGLRPLVRPATARPRRQRRGLLARIWPFVHHLPHQRRPGELGCRDAAGSGHPRKHR